MATSDLCFVCFKKDFGASFFFLFFFFFFFWKKNTLFPLALDFSRDSNPKRQQPTTSVVWRAIAVSFGNASATILCFGGGRSVCLFVFCCMFEARRRRILWQRTTKTFFGEQACAIVVVVVVVFVVAGLALLSSAPRLLCGGECLPHMFAPLSCGHLLARVWYFPSFLPLRTWCKLCFSSWRERITHTHTHTHTHIRNSGFFWKRIGEKLGVKEMSPIHVCLLPFFFFFGFFLAGS